jgi:hypothetical protein
MFGHEHKYMQKKVMKLGSSNDRVVVANLQNKSVTQTLCIN